MSDTEAQVIPAEEKATKEAVKESPTKVKSAGWASTKETAPEPEEVTNDDEDSKASENGQAKSEESKENGSSEEKEIDEKEVDEEVDEKEAESTNGDSTDAPTDNVYSIKRKSTGGEVTDDAAKDVVSPKKAKIDEKAPAVEVEANGGQ